MHISWHLEEVIWHWEIPQAAIGCRTLFLHQRSLTRSLELKKNSGVWPFSPWETCCGKTPVAESHSPVKSWGRDYFPPYPGACFSFPYIALQRGVCLNGSTLLMGWKAKNCHKKKKNLGATVDENNRAISNTVWLQTNRQGLNNKNGFHFQALCWFPTLAFITLNWNFSVHLMFLSLDQNPKLAQPCLGLRCLHIVWCLGTCAEPSSNHKT